MKIDCTDSITFSCSRLNWISKNKKLRTQLICNWILERPPPFHHSDSYLYSIVQILKNSFKKELAQMSQIWTVKNYIWTAKITQTTLCSLTTENTEKPDSKLKSSHPYLIGDIKYLYTISINWWHLLKYTRRIWRTRGLEESSSLAYLQWAACLLLSPLTLVIPVNVVVLNHYPPSPETTINCFKISWKPCSRLADPRSFMPTYTHLWSISSNAASLVSGWFHFINSSNIFSRKPTYAHNF